MAFAETTGKMGQSFQFSTEREGGRCAVVDVGDVGKLGDVIWGNGVTVGDIAVGAGVTTVHAENTLINNKVTINFPNPEFIQISRKSIPANL
jgi:hypothetical protein